MRIRQKVCGKRYYIYARRSKNENWSDWTSTNDIDRASFHVENIRNCGFIAKLVDKETKEILVKDGT